MIPTRTAISVEVESWLKLDGSISQALPSSLVTAMYDFAELELDTYVAASRTKVNIQAIEKYITVNIKRPESIWARTVKLMVTTCRF